MKRVAFRLVCILVVLVALFYVGGGWYFSGQIAAGALDVRHEDDFTLEVTAVGDGRVTLAVRDEAPEQPALATAMTYGLVWDGGYGQISGPAETATGSGATRRLEMLEGSRPRVGAQARLDRDAFPSDDAELTLASTVHDVTYSAGGKDFPDWFVPGRGDTWVVLVHGARGADRGEPLRAMRVAEQVGMPSLDITYRNDLGAPGDPSDQYQYGRTEWRDLEGAVRYSLDHGAKQVVLVGFSMGGAVTAAFLQNSELAPSVSRVVLDAPMLDLRTVIEYGAAQRDLPLIGEVPGSLVWTAEQMTAARDDVDWEATDYVDDSDWLGVPTLVLHGKDDLLVPVGLSRRLAADHPGTVTLKVVADAGHVEAWNADPAAYERTLTAFLQAA